MKRAVALLVILAVLAATVLAYLNRQLIEDHLAAQRFERSEPLITLATHLHLTDAGARIFWASAPTLETNQRFNEQCRQVEHAEEGHILGCYAHRRIHLFEVTDERLSGIVEVTAAHELLHAVFARLSNEQRTAMNERLLRLYEDIISTDNSFETRMSVYEGLPRSTFANELHSVLGTEQRELPAWLEQHYANWFTNRAAILDYFDSYNTLFAELKERSEQLQDEITQLNTQIEQRSSAYEAAVTRFNDEWNEFVRRNEAFEFSAEPDEFYRLRDELTARRDALESERIDLNEAIDRYEQLHAEWLSLSELNHEIEQQLDSALAPPAPMPPNEP